MKHGDKIYCKKTYEIKSSEFLNITRTWFIIDKQYIIQCNKLTNEYFIIDEEGDKNYVILNEQFDKYFYTEKEYRKIKLEKIYEISKII